ncbi:unnamed protein product, partial [Aureobasidium pullulans]
TDLVMLNSDLTRFERESIARLREEEARYKGVSKTIAFLTPRRPLYTRSASGAYGSSSYYEPGTLPPPPLRGSRIYLYFARYPTKRRPYSIYRAYAPYTRAKPTSRSTRTSYSLAILRRRIKELSATSPSVRRIPTFRDKEDPTLMSGGTGRLVNPTLNASSPYVRPSPTNDYNLLRGRSPRLSSTSRGRDATRTYTPKHISLANRTRRLYAVSPKERKQRRRNFEATTKAKRLIDAKELVKEERRAIERSRYLSRGDPPIFDLYLPSRSRSPSPNFPASYAVSAIKVLLDFICFRYTYYLKATKIDAYNASHEPGISKAC